MSRLSAMVGAGLGLTLVSVLVIGAPRVVIVRIVRAAPAGPVDKTGHTPTSLTRSPACIRQMTSIEDRDRPDQPRCDVI
jgi:hypothetical protein